MNSRFLQNETERERERWAASEPRVGYESWVLNRAEQRVSTSWEEEWVSCEPRVGYESWVLNRAEQRVSTSWEREWVSCEPRVGYESWVLNRAEQRVGEFLKGLILYAITVRITLVWHVSSLHLAGSSSGESVNELMDTMTPKSVKRISSFERLTHESHITTRHASKPRHG